MQLWQLNSWRRANLTINQLVACILVVSLVASAACVPQQRSISSSLIGFTNESVGFSISYPEGWYVNQGFPVPPYPSVTRFSTFKVEEGPQPASRRQDAEVLIEVKFGLLSTTWPRSEIEKLKSGGYRARAITLAGLDGIRLTDSRPHFGLYDVVYLAADSASIRIHLSTESEEYGDVFERMLRTLAFDKRLALRANLTSQEPITTASTATATVAMPTPTPTATPRPSPTRLPSPTATASPSPTRSPSPSTKTPPRSSPTGSPSLMATPFPAATKTQTATPQPLLLAFLAAREAVTPQPSATPVPTRPLAEVVSPVLAGLVRDSLNGKEGIYGVAIKHLGTGETALVNADRQFDAASLYKVPVMVEALKQWRGGKVALTEEITVTEKAATHYDDGEPTAPISSTLMLADAVERMIVVSDNTAGHVLLEKLEGWRISQTMRQLGLSQTEILDGIRTSPLDMMRLLELIAIGQAVDAEASEMMVQLLLAQRVRDRLPRFLPPGTRVANKTGNWTDLRHDVGIIYAPNGPYVIAVLAEGLEDGEKGSLVIAELSRAVYDYFNSSQP